MMNLSTSPEALSEVLVRVYWRTGKATAGAVDIELPHGTTDPLIVAEVCAIRYLAFERKVFNRMPLTGKGFQFTVSSDQILNIAMSNSPKQILIAYARFFREQLLQSVVTVRTNAVPVDLEVDSSELQIDRVFADPNKYTAPIELSINSPAMGTVLITRHALERYTELGNRGLDPIKNPFLSLQKRLTRNDLVKVELPQSVVEHKIKKYGPLQQPECWTRPGSTLFFQVIIVNGVRTMVTVFRRSEI